MKTWYLGIHRPSWLPQLATVPAFISRRVFLDSRTGQPRRTFPRAAGHYAVDSGGFTELQRYGGWTIGPDEYVDFLHRLREETGPFDWAAPQDWMAEPAVIAGGTFAGLTFVGTGLTLHEHQRRTVDNYLQLRNLAPDLPIIPVVQGWRRHDYTTCANMYAAAGIDLTTEPLVGLGSVCRRQNTDEAADIIEDLHDRGITRLHGFGFKISGLRTVGHLLTTADSMSWSLDGRHAGPCQHPPYLTGKRPRSEANCLRYALQWRARHIRLTGVRIPERQLTLPLEVAA